MNWPSSPVSPLAPSVVTLRLVAPSSPPWASVPMPVSFLPRQFDSLVKTIVSTFLPSLPKEEFLNHTYSAGRACRFSINPNPFFIRRGFEPLPKSLANHWQGT